MDKNNEMGPIWLKIAKTTIKLDLWCSDKLDSAEIMAHALRRTCSWWKNIYKAPPHNSKAHRWEISVELRKGLLDKGGGIY